MHDKAALDATYQFYAEQVLPSVPLPAVDQFSASQQALAKGTPSVAKIDLNSLVDPEFVQKATQSS